MTQVSLILALIIYDTSKVSTDHNKVYNSNARMSYNLALLILSC